MSLSMCDLLFGHRLGRVMSGLMRWPVAGVKSSAAEVTMLLSAQLSCVRWPDMTSSVVRTYGRGLCLKISWHGKAMWEGGGEGGGGVSWGRGPAHRCQASTSTPGSCRWVPMRLRPDCSEPQKVSTAAACHMTTLTPPPYSLPHCLCITCINIPITACALHFHCNQQGRRLI